MRAAASATPRAVLDAMYRTGVRSVRDLDIAVAALLLLRPAPSSWRGAQQPVHRLLTTSEPTPALLQVFATVPATAVRAEAQRAAEHLPRQWMTPELLAEVLSASEEQAAADIAEIHRAFAVDKPALRSALLAIAAAMNEATALAAVEQLRSLIQAPAPSGLEWPTLASMRIAAIRALRPKTEPDSAHQEAPIRLRTFADPAPTRWNRHALTIEREMGIDFPFIRDRLKFGDGIPANIADATGSDEIPTNPRPTTSAKPPNTAGETAPGEKINRTVERRLQALIRDASTDEPRRATFRRAVAHVVSIYVSPGDLGGLVAEQPIAERDLTFSSPEQGRPAVATLQVDFISPGPGGAQTVQTKELSVPRQGPSTPAEFELWAPATTTTLTCTIVLRQAHTVLQTARLTGPVADLDDAPADQGLALTVLGEFVRDMTGPNLNAPARSTAVQASVSTNLGTAEQAMYVPADGKPVMVSLAATSVLRERLETTLREALDVEATIAPDPATASKRESRAAAKARLELLRSLAQQGSALWQEMEPLHGLSRLEHIQIVSGDDDMIPFEFLYDLGFPADDATLCRTWRTALATGACSCLDRPRTPQEATDRGQAWESKTVCPLGFWGLRIILERQVTSASTGSALSAGMPDGQRNRLAPMSSVLFAASAKVDGADSLADPFGESAAPAATPASRIAETIAALRRNPGVRLAEATTWPDWRKQIKSAKPGLLLAIPHNELSANGQSRLEIGAGSFVNVGALDPAYVMPPLRRRAAAARSAQPEVEPVGPVVFLLGCNTASDELPWQTAAAAFRRLGAAVVVGTLIQALGRQSAPMAQMLGELLWGESSVRAETMGEVIVAIRRQLVLKGMTLGMSLIAFGHAGWLLPMPDES